MDVSLGFVKRKKCLKEGKKMTVSLKYMYCSGTWLFLIWFASSDPIAVMVQDLIHLHPSFLPFNNTLIHLHLSFLPL